MEGMIDDFPDSVDEYLANIRSCVVAQDAPELREQAHKLKGAAAFLEALDTVESAKALEICGKEGDLVGAVPRLSELEANLVALCQRLRMHRQLAPH